MDIKGREAIFARLSCLGCASASTCDIEKGSAATCQLTTKIAEAFEAAGYRRLPEGNHLLPDSDRREIIDYLLKSMPGRWKTRDVIEVCVRSMSELCLKRARGE